MKLFSPMIKNIINAIINKSHVGISYLDELSKLNLNIVEYQNSDRVFKHKTLKIKLF